jgi:phage gp29-like protein
MATLYDQFNRPIEMNKLTQELAAPTLAGVRSIWTNQIASGLTPGKLARLLRSASDGDHDDYLVLAEEMEERHLHYYAELSKRKLAVSRLPLTVEAASDNEPDQKLADAVRNLIKRPGMRSLIKNMLDAIAKGFAVSEIIWDRSGKQWLPTYKWRSQRFFRFDRESLSVVRLIDESDTLEGIPLPPYKFIVHTPVMKSGIPIRGGLARLAAWSFMCHGYTMKDWMAFSEVFGMPLRLGKYPAGADPKDIDILKMAVANLGSDAAAVFPDSMLIELVEAAKSAGANEFYKILAVYLDDGLSVAIVGQRSSSGGTPGKLGDEKLQSEVRDDIRDDDAEQIEETLNRDLVRPFIDLNYGPQEIYPWLCLRAVKQEDIKTLSAALKDLVPLGLEVEQSVVRDKLGLPDPAEGAKILMGPAHPAPPPEPGKTKSATNRTAKAINQNGQAETEDDPDAVEALIDEELSDWEPMMSPVIDGIDAAIAELIASGLTLQDLLTRLPQIYGDQDVQPLADALATAMLKARAMGDATDEV